MDFSTDSGPFLALAKLGDRLEFRRDGYCHWAIYVGEQYIPIDDKVIMLPVPYQYLPAPGITSRLSNPIEE